MNGLEAFSPDQFYRVVLAMVTAVVVALVLTIFSAVVEPSKTSSAAMSSDGYVERMSDPQPKTQFVAVEWW